MQKNLPLCITMGEPSGISAEISLKTWLERKKLNICDFFLIDNYERMREITKEFDLDVPIKKIKKPEETREIFKDFLPIIDIGSNIQPRLGKPEKKYSKFILQSINMSIEYVLKKKAKALVTNPVCKKTLIQSGFRFSGQTEYISNYLSKLKNQKFNEIMILTSTKPCDKGNKLKVGLITTHIPIREVSKNLSKKLVITKTISFINSLKNFWKISDPIVGICGLNPHSGEDGLIGSEEKEIILPALRFLNKTYKNLYGLLSADTCFNKFNRKRFDGIICMFHDQGLVPIKTLDFFNSVNITGGLPIIRTSPDHGPAFDIATLNKASNKSLIAAINVASKLSKK